MQTSGRRARRNTITAIVLSLLFFALFTFVVFKRIEDLTLIVVSESILLLTSFFLYNWFTSKYRKRKQILSKPFPSSWKAILNQSVQFYNRLDSAKQQDFEQSVQIFLLEKRVTGIKTEIDDKVRLLVAASAVIPIFGFKEWEYDNLSEILIYPGAFGDGYDLEKENSNILGMVGNGPMTGIMILSKTALIDGFKVDNDKKNVGIHEFVHLIDGIDGSIDGIPGALLDKQFLIPWLSIIHEEINNIKSGNSDINPYGATNAQEFFAVTSEYFFEHPKKLKRKYPELYILLKKIFHQDLIAGYFQSVKEALHIGGKKVGRNSKCPCESGSKYKHCCLKNHTNRILRNK